MIDYWIPYVVTVLAKLAGYLFLVMFLLDITGKLSRWAAITYCRVFYDYVEDSKDDSADVTQEVDK